MRCTFSIKTVVTKRCPWPDGRLLPSQSLQNDKNHGSDTSVNCSAYSSPVINAARSSNISDDSCCELIPTFRPRYSCHNSWAAFLIIEGSTDWKETSAATISSRASSVCSEDIWVGGTVG